MRVALLVCSIIAFVFSIPAALCFFGASAISGLATDAMSQALDATGETSVATVQATGLVGSILALGSVFGIILSVLTVAAFIFAILAYVKPKTPIAMVGGIVMLLAGVVLIFTIVAANVTGLIAGILYVLAGIFAFVAKPKAAASAPAA